MRVTPLADVPLGTTTSPHRACFLQFRGEQPSGLGHRIPYQGHGDLAWHSGVHLRQHLQKRRGELQRRQLRLDADSDSYAQRSSRDTPLTSRATSLPAFTRYLSIAYTWRRSSRVSLSVPPSAWADVAQQVEQLTRNEMRSAVRVRSSALCIRHQASRLGQRSGAGECKDDQYLFRLVPNGLSGPPLLATRFMAESPSDC